MDNDNGNDVVEVIIIILAIFSIVLYIALTRQIKKKMNNIFISVRSINITHVINFCIILAIIVASICYLFYDNLPNLIKAFYFSFEFISFFAIILRYHRIYLCCKTTSNVVDDDSINFSYFSSKNYHYEYFYMRIIFVSTFILIIFTISFYYINDQNGEILENLEIFISKQSTISSLDSIYFWMIYTFIKCFISFTYFFLFTQCDFKRKLNLHKEVAFIFLLNFLYSILIILDIIILNENKKEVYGIYIPLFTIILLLLYYIVVIILPIRWAQNYIEITNYELGSEHLNSLYLFLTKEKYLNIFYWFLSNDYNNKEKNIYFLEICMELIQYKILYNNCASNSVLTDLITKIERKYLNNNLAKKYLDSQLLIESNSICQKSLISSKNFKGNMFENLFGKVFGYLEMKFNLFKKTEYFSKYLVGCAKSQTFIHCKLCNCGMIKI